MVIVIESQLLFYSRIVSVETVVSLKVSFHYTFLHLVMTFALHWNYVSHFVSILEPVFPIEFRTLISLLINFRIELQC